MPRAGEIKPVPEVAKEICKLISEGKSLREACRACKVKPGTFLEWRDKDHGLAEHYAGARAQMFDVWEEQLRETARKAQGLDQAGVQAAKLEIDTVKWIMSKRRPEVWGDRIDATITTRDGDLAEKLQLARARISAVIVDAPRAALPSGVDEQEANVEQTKSVSLDDKGLTSLHNKALSEDRDNLCKD